VEVGLPLGGFQRNWLRLVEVVVVEPSYLAQVVWAEELPEDQLLPGVVLSLLVAQPLQLGLLAPLFKAVTEETMEAQVVVVSLVVAAEVMQKIMVGLVALGLPGEPLRLPIKALEQHRR